MPIHHCYTPGALAVDLSEGVDHHQIIAQLDACTTCSEAAATLHEWAGWTGHPDPLVWPERATAPSFLDVLLEVPRRRRSGLIRGDDLLHHWGLCRLLIDRANAAAGGELRSHFAQLALTVAMCLDEEIYGSGPVADLRAQCWLLQARCLLGSQDPAVAEHALHRARFFARSRGAQRDCTDLVARLGAEDHKPRSSPRPLTFPSSIVERDAQASGE